MSHLPIPLLILVCSVFWSADKPLALAQETDESLRRSMGQGACDYGKKQTFTDPILPAKFWSLPPKEAALQFMEINRSPAHRLRYQLVVKAGTNNPPESARISIESMDGGCTQNSTMDVYFFVKGREGFFGWNDSVLGSPLFATNYKEIIPEYKFGLKAVNPTDLLHLAQTTWWFDQVYTQKRTKPLPALKDADAGRQLPGGQGAFVWEVRYPNAGLDRTWHDLNNGFQDDWGNEDSLCPPAAWKYFLMQTALPNRLEQNRVDTEVADSMIETVLKQRLSDSNSVTLTLVRPAIMAAGDRGLVNLRGLLSTLKDTIEPPIPDVLKAEKEGVDPISLFTRDELDRHYFLKYIDVARTQLDAFTDVVALTKMVRGADSSSHKLWALNRLRLLDMSQYEAALTHCCVEECMNVQNLWFLEDYLESDIGHRIASAIPPGRTNRYGRFAMDLFDLKRPIPDENVRVQSMLSRKDPFLTDTLVPIENPLRFKQPEIDQALIEAFRTEQNRYRKSQFALLLIRRDPNTHLRKVLHTFSSPKARPDKRLCSELLLAMNRISDRTSRKIVVKTLEEKEWDGIRQEIFLAGWAADVRELTPWFRKLATKDSAEIERRPSLDARNVDADMIRYHMPRKILAIWDEQNPEQLAKRLVVFGSQGPYIPWNNPHYSTRLETSFKRAVRACTKTQREGIQAFISESTGVRPIFERWLGEP